MIYLDTSVVAPLYWREALSDTVEELVLTETKPNKPTLQEISEMVKEVRREQSKEAIQKKTGISPVQPKISD